MTELRVSRGVVCGRLTCPLCFDALITYIRCVGEINIDSIPPAPLGMNVSNMETIILLCEQYNGMEQTALFRWVRDLVGAERRPGLVRTVGVTYVTVKQLPSQRSSLRCVLTKTARGRREGRSY